jgi:hypothetical protein
MEPANYVATLCDLGESLEKAGWEPVVLTADVLDPERTDPNLRRKTLALLFLSAHHAQLRMALTDYAATTKRPRFGAAIATHVATRHGGELDVGPQLRRDTIGSRSG